MQNLMTFKGNRVETITVKDIIYFNPYHVGECLGLSESAVRKALSKMPKTQAVKLTNSIGKDIPNYEIPPSGKLFLTESGVYKLVFRSNKPDAEEFANWVADEVLPSIRRTGSYSVEQGKQTTIYEYYDKYLNGVPVMTVLDVEHFTGISAHMINYYLARKPFKRGADYYYLALGELKKFKQENPRISKNVNSIFAITKSGFDKLLKRAGVKMQTPECFKQLPPPKVNDLDKAKEKLEKIRHRMDTLNEVLEDYEHRYKYTKALGESPREYAWIVAADIMTEIQRLPIKEDLFA